MELLAVSVLVTLCFQAAITEAKMPDWVPAEVLEMVDDDKKQCMSEHGVDQGAIDRANDGDIANDRGMMCYMRCIYTAISMMDEDGNFEVEMAVGLMPEEMRDQARQVIETCGREGGADLCERVFNINVCYQKQAPNLWVLL